MNEMKHARVQTDQPDPSAVVVGSKSSEICPRHHGVLRRREEGGEDRLIAISTQRRSPPMYSEPENKCTVNLEKLFVSESQHPKQAANTMNTQAGTPEASKFVVIELDCNDSRSKALALNEQADYALRSETSHTIRKAIACVVLGLFLIILVGVSIRCRLYRYKF